MYFGCRIRFEGHGEGDVDSVGTFSSRKAVVEWLRVKHEFDESDLSGKEGETLDIYVGSSMRDYPTYFTFWYFELASVDYDTDGYYSDV